jgi:hypothetical protein
MFTGGKEKPDPVQTPDAVKEMIGGDATPDLDVIALERAAPKSATSYDKMMVSGDETFDKESIQKSHLTSAQKRMLLQQADRRERIVIMPEH